MKIYRIRNESVMGIDYYFVIANNIKDALQKFLSSEKLGVDNEYTVGIEFIGDVVE